MGLTLGFVSLWETWWALFFLIGLDPSVLGGGAAVAELRKVSRAPGPPRLSAGPAVAPELAVRSRPRLVGDPALHLMRSGRLSHPGAPAARSHSPSNTPARAQNAHNLAGPRTHWNAQTRSVRTHSPAPWDALSVPGPGMPAAGARGRGPCRSLPRVTALGRRARARRSLLAFPLTTLRRAFVLSPSLRGRSTSSPLSPRHPARSDFRPSFGSLSLSLFPSPVPFLSLVWLPGKSCFSKFAEVVSKSPWGWLRTGGCEKAIHSRSSSRLAPAFPRAAGLGTAANTDPIVGAEPRVGEMAGRGHPDFFQDLRSLLWGRNCVAQFPFFLLLPPSSPKP